MNQSETCDGCCYLQKVFVNNNKSLDINCQEADGRYITYFLHAKDGLNNITTPYWCHYAGVNNPFKK